MKVVSTKNLANVLGKKHEEIMFIVTAIILKHPNKITEFIPHKNELKVTIDGIELIIEFLSVTSGIEKLLRLMEAMTEGE